MNSSSPISLSHAVGHSFKNRTDLERSESCACFYCYARFTPAEIRDWEDSDDPEWGDDGHEQPDLVRFPGLTAICPFCERDSVIGSASGYEITDQFLHSLHNYWHVSKLKP